MTYVLFGSAVVLGLFLKKSKICSAYIIIIMLILSIYNYQSADMNNYKTSYALALETDSFRYLGYSMIIKCCAKIGLSWLQYRWLFYITVFSLLYIAIRMLTKNVNMVLALYLITYYGIDVVQMKSHIADVLAFFAIAYMVKSLSEGKMLKSWRTVFSIFILFLSALMHFATVFYLSAFVMWAIMYRQKNMTKKMIAIAVVALVLMYGGIVTVVAQYANQLGILGDMNYLGNWFVRKTHLGYLLPSIFVVMVVLSCVIPKQILTKEVVDIQPTLLFSKQFIITSVMLLPLFVMNVTYIRLIRVYVLLALINYAEGKIKLEMTKTELLCALASVMTIMMSIYDGTYAFFDTTLGSILKYNSML